MRGFDGFASQVARRSCCAVLFPSCNDRRYGKCSHNDAMLLEVLNQHKGSHIYHFDHIFHPDACSRVVPRVHDMGRVRPSWALYPLVLKLDDFPGTNLCRRGITGRCMHISIWLISSTKRDSTTAGAYRTVGISWH